MDWKAVNRAQVQWDRDVAAWLIDQLGLLGLDQDEAIQPLLIALTDQIERTAGPTHAAPMLSIALRPVLARWYRAIHAVR